MIVSCDLSGIWQQVLWKTNWSESDESAGQYRPTPSLCAKSGHKQLPFPLSHPMEIPSDLSSHTHMVLTHTYSDSCLITQTYTCIHTLLKRYSRKPPHNPYIPTSTPSSNGQSPHPLTPPLMSQSAGSIHFIAVRHHRSAPFSVSQLSSRGAHRRREEGAWNIQTVQRLLISYPLWLPRNMAFWCCVAACMHVWEMKERKGIKKRSRSQDVFFWSLCMVSDLPFTFVRLVC